ncbi:hypothetical protein B0T22DRAFT_82542 [Podospora appendiculata]|uniref:RGS domain-containing protein n=1 Tax=Podospora appendiculata TaxID=314037 RepID=A0AAE0XJZ2_9PEZI|nr:hypothetical protein B0T22DRAFT_82542 [Podospora appendiculata]
MGLLPLNYRRPPYVEKTRSSSEGAKSQASINSGSDNADKPTRSLKSARSANALGIPPALSFDKIIEGGTCPPCTTRDFMNYLVYVERSAENLQFYLWHRGYVKRFEQASTRDLALASEWTRTMEDEAAMRIQKDHAENLRRDPKSSMVAEVFQGTDFEKGSQIRMGSFSDSNPFSTPPATPGEHEDLSDFVGSNATSYRIQVNEAFSSAGLKAPFTIQPFRKEIERVIATYIMDGAPRQLNISDREQKAVLQALAYTTHPSAFRTISTLVESELRRQGHPNFIRWSICNGNSARVLFARVLGVGLVASGLGAALVITLSRAGRGYRALAAIVFVLGIATLIAGYKGMCVVLHGMHHRHVRPWELFMADEEGVDEAKKSLDSFGSSNSYEEEPWVIRYKRRNIIRKIFDREVWIQEPALRQIQDTIFVQSVLCAVVGAGILTGVFMAVPGGNFF